ncbi:hypothetical protein [Rhodopseudomonas telluris]|uniref:Uncharacterized protein n=1 Tax=Rhodopseudomonas telluris TaxID=644215 RepID=A0ABV6EPL1_9BRAD
MTAISSASTSSYLSPLQQLQKELAAELSAGQISSSDASSLSTALNDIDTALQGGNASDANGTQAPGDLKSKIDDLIGKEVSNGTLTTDQAAKLKTVFAQTFGQGPGGPGGPPPDGAGAADAGASSSSSSSSSSDGSGSVDDLVKQFLELLQQTQASSANSYGSAGTTSNATSFSALLVDYKT